MTARPTGVRPTRAHSLLKKHNHIEKGASMISARPRTIACARFALVVGALAVLLAGCATPAAPPASPTVTATPSPSGTPTVFHSVNFADPLTVSLFPSLNPIPIEDSPGLLTWGETGNDVNRIRFLIPAKVYGERGEFPVLDYSAYIQTLHSQGGILSHKGTVTVAGQTVPIVTVNEPGGTDGSIGCSSEDALQHDPDHCFTYGPDYSIRVVTLTVHGKTFVAWARTSPDKYDARFNALFEKMLGTITFG